MERERGGKNATRDGALCLAEIRAHVDIKEEEGEGDYCAANNHLL